VATGKRILYSEKGRLTGTICTYQISIVHDGKRHFRAVINGEWYNSLSQRFVEKYLGILVHVKRSGSEVGYPSEPVPRSVWRHLVDRYNDFDDTVYFEPN
jgi:hypothetical protein